jgi:hypothetical protein
MKSNHKISKAEIQAIKGIRYANIEENLETAKHREQKYFLRMEEYEMMESIREFFTAKLSYF